MKRTIVIFLLALTAVPFTAGAASASNHTEKVACLFYQPFRERDITDCL